MVQVVARNENNNIVLLDGGRESFRMRQRAKTSDGLKVPPLRFVSYKEAEKIRKNKIVYGPVEFYSVSKL